MESKSMRKSRFFTSPAARLRRRAAKLLSGGAGTDRFLRETVAWWRRALARLDVTSRSLIALVEPGSCFAGPLMELVLAADRSFMYRPLDEPDEAPGIALGVLTADCQPVLFADTKAGVIGAAHAGWKGALRGVLEATVDAMVATGAIRERIVAVIGPAIGQDSYEVGPEFLDMFRSSDPGNLRFFATGEGDRYRFDLPGYGLSRLRAAGIAHAEWTRHCTYSDDTRFYSCRRGLHRREADFGRLISSIRL